MGLAVDASELLNADLGVDAGRVQAGVTEQLLDVADVGSTFEHVGGAGVTKQVTGSIPFDASRFYGLADHSGEDVGVERFAMK